MGRHFIEAAKKGMCQHHINVAAVVVPTFRRLGWFDDYDEGGGLGSGIRDPNRRETMRLILEVM